MSKRVRIGLIGSFEPERPSHPATEEALAHAAADLGLELETSWLPSGSLKTLPGPGAKAPGMPDSLQGVFAPPGKVYADPAKALAAIRFCRERLRPFFGT